MCVCVCVRACVYTLKHITVSYIYVLLPAKSFDRRAKPPLREFLVW